MEYFQWILILLPLLSVLTYFGLVHRKILFIALKTFPRDFRLVTAVVKLQLRLRLMVWRNATIGSIFESLVRKHPDKPCFYFEDEVWTFAQVDKLANQFGNYFQKLGYRKGDHVALYMENRVEYICTWLGLSKIGVVTALINHNLSHEPLTHCIQLSKCRALIYGYGLQDVILETARESPLLSNIKLFCFGANGNRVDQSALDLDQELKTSPTTPPEASEKLGINDTLMLIYTSGTTGLPKAAIIPHTRVMVTAYGGKLINGTQDKDIIYVPIPLYHNLGGNMGAAQALVSGISVVLTKKFSASRFWKDCIRYNVTVALYLGETCRFLLNQPPSPEDKQHKVRMMYGVGLRPEIWPEFLKRFNNPRMAETYGATEGNAFLVNIDGHPGAVGYMPVLARYLLPQTLVRIDVETGNPVRDELTGFVVECKANEPGEMISPIRNSDPLQHYEGYTDSSSSEKKVIRDVFKKGDMYCRSGDILSFDDHGYFYFRDRSGDTFRWKGENVSTTEVEGIINKLTDFRDAVVYGVEVPNSEGKAGMVAIVDTDASLDIAALGRGIQRQLPSYARPVFLRIVSEINLTGTFKFQKMELQQEGFDIHRIQSGKLYVLRRRGYVLMNSDLYLAILSGELRL